MHLGILSDTHGQLARTTRAVATLINQGAEALVHCGDLTGPELVGRLLGGASAAEAGVLFISGYPADVVQRHGVDPARTAFLQKPFRPQAFLEAVRGLAALSGPSRRPRPRPRCS